MFLLLQQGQAEFELVSYCCNASSLYEMIHFVKRRNVEVQVL